MDGVMIQIKRVYGDWSRRDGLRILVDRIWPRGVRKERARIHEWRKDLAPSTSLRTWFGHDLAKWPEFRRRYRAELKRSAEAKAFKDLIREERSKMMVTLVYSAVDQKHNQAVVLKQFLEEKTGS